MQRALLACLIALSASACATQLTPVDRIQIVTSPADVRVCTRLDEVSPVTTTTPGSVLANEGFNFALDKMRQSTLEMGGTHIYLEKTSDDWSLVRGIAYRCDPGVNREDPVPAPRARHRKKS